MEPLTRSQSKDVAILDTISDYLRTHPKPRTQPFTLTKGSEISEDETKPQQDDDAAFPTTEPRNAAAASSATTAAAETGGPEVDVILHNMYADSDFVTVRRQSRLSVDKLVVNMAGLVADGVFSVINLSASKHSFVAVVACEKGWSEVEGRIIAAAV
ncbi:hypothetical protein MBLNU459_g7592t1 [Dothideomycetes sp. NU459]